MITALVLLAAVYCSAELIELEAQRDNTLFEALPPFDASSAEANRSNGGGDHLFCGRSKQREEALQRRRGLIHFAVSDAIPPDAHITDVTLVLYLSQTITEPAFKATEVTLHRLRRNWGEGRFDPGGQEGGGANAQSGDATWLHTFFAAAMWAEPGGDWEPTPSATAMIGNRNLFYSWSGEGLASDAQNWLEDPAGNFGWILIGDESEAGTAKRFDSRESFDFDVITGNRTAPRLIVEYVVPGDASSSLWPDSIDLGQGWRWSAWWGTFNNGFFPWILHQQHGWLYISGTDPASFWVFDSALAWWWSAASLYPSLFRAHDETWLFFDAASSEPRLFFNFATGTWEAVVIRNSETGRDTREHVVLDQATRKQTFQQRLHHGKLR